MRIMTANLKHDYVSVDAFAETLDRFVPDVVAIQELGADAANVLRERFPFGLSTPGGVMGCGLVGREPLDVERINLPFRPLLTAPVAIGDQVVALGSVHLANPVATNDLPFRRSQVRALLTHVSGTDPMVLVGDLNSSPTWPAYRLLTRHLRDGVKDWAARSGKRPIRTWNYGSGTPKLLRIDHILVRGVELADVQAIDIPGSDHRALIADVI